MSEWKKVKLKDCCHSISDGDHLPPPKSNSGVPFVTIANIDATNHIDFGNTMFVPLEYYNNLNDIRKAKCNDILYSVVGSFGKPVLIKENIPFAFQRHIAILRPNNEIADSRFLYYVMLTRDFFMQADTVAIGAAQRTISLTALRNMEVKLPSMETQYRIANILSRYDSLIENYQKQIKLLEEAAQRLYKEWFVDLRFPGHENTKIVDGVPEGWEKKKLCEFTGITDGTHDSPKQVEIGFPLVTGRCIVDGSIDFSQAYKISEEDVIKINKRSAVEDGDILLSNIGTIGKVCRISKSGNYVVKNMIIFKPHDAIHSCFLHRFLTDNNTQMDFLQQAAGTSQKFVSLSFIRNTLILRPSDTILNLFYNHSEKYFNYVQSLQSQLRLLTEARDRLLPKLMSGEIEI